MQNKYIYFSIFSLLIAVSFLFTSGHEYYVYADENDVLSFVPYGAFNHGVNLTNLPEPQNFSQTVYWDYVQGFDYIYFRDSTTEPGFRLQLYLSSSETGNFVYSGQSLAQGPIDKSNFRIFGEYQSATPLAPSKGVDDNSKTLSINSVQSCLNAQNLSNYMFNANLDYGDHALILDEIESTYLTSLVDCPVEGKIDIRRMELTYPPNTAEGSYETTFIILILDGAGV
jgi:hypothetical protein